MDRPGLTTQPNGWLTACKTSTEPWTGGRWTREPWTYFVVVVDGHSAQTDARIGRAWLRWGGKLHS